MKNRILLLLLVGVLNLNQSFAQVVYRPQPSEWKNLVEGGQFMDRFLPMPNGKLSSDVWGAKAVLPRYVDNGIEDDTISYWGGNILKGDDGQYHFFLCGWREDNPQGHMGYVKYSEIFHAVSDNQIGPFKPIKNLGEGHNTEIIHLKDGRYMVYFIIGQGKHEEHCKYLIADKLNGPWESHSLLTDTRNRPLRLGGGIWSHNMSFCKREDGSVIMLSRMGSIWVSETGTSSYKLVTNESIYPKVDGRFEDPVIWKDHVQYHAIVNDWIGRTAFYLRSKDGVNWITEPGQAYAPGVAVHKDGRQEGWYKYERIRMFQDEYGRAIQANFAVIDTLKHYDLPKDKHSSKNIAIPLNPGMLLSIENKLPFNHKTKEIKVRIKAENGFKPIKEVDTESLKFGASSEVNYGRGAKVLRTEVEGNDLVVVFEAKNHCVDEKVFAPKIIGKNKKGEMLYGYARLPWIKYNESILSASQPVLRNGKLEVEIENFGQVVSKEAIITIRGYNVNGQEELWASKLLSHIPPYKSVKIELEPNIEIQAGMAVLVSISASEGHCETFQTLIAK